jgi:hypothetical protein
MGTKKRKEDTSRPPSVIFETVIFEIAMGNNIPLLNDLISLFSYKYTQVIGYRRIGNVFGNHSISQWMRKTEFELFSFSRN